MHVLTIESRYEPLLLKELCGNPMIWGYGADEEGWRTYNFADDVLEAFTEAMDQHDAVRLSKLKDTVLDELGAIRWDACQTFTYDGVVAPADPALMAVCGYVMANQLAPITGTTVWKLSKNTFRNWTVTDVVTYGIAIRAHIQECFNREADFAADIDAAETVEDVLAINFNTGWPE